MFWKLWKPTTTGRVSKPSNQYVEEKCNPNLVARKSNETNSVVSEEKSVAFGKTILSHPMLTEISRELSKKVISVIEKDIAIADRNVCNSFFHFHVSQTGVHWSKTIGDTRFTSGHNYSDYNISIVEDMDKIQGIVWALTTLVSKNVHSKYSQIVNWHAEQRTKTEHTIEVILFFELKLDTFQSL